LSTARKVLSNTVYQLIGRFSMAAMAVIILKLITGYLGVAGYGNYVTIYEFLGFFAIFADMGIYTIAVREMAVNEKKIPIVIGNIMGLRSTLAIIMLIIAVGTAFLLPQYQSSRIPMGILIASVTTFFTMLQNTLCSVLQIHYKMQYSTLAMILGKLVSVLYVIFIIFYLYPKFGVGASLALIQNLRLAGLEPNLASFPLEQGFLHLIFGGLLGSVVMYAVTRHYVHRLEKFKNQFDLKYWISVLKTSIPYGLALILNNIYFKVDVLILSLMLDPKQAGMQTGMYGVAMRILEMLVIIPVYFMNSVLPIMMKLIKEKSKKIHVLIQYSFDFLIATGAPILVGIGVLSIEIVRLISTKNFVSHFDQGIMGSDVVLQILMFALVFSFVNSLFGFILVALGKQIKLLWINSLCVMFNLGANILVIPYYGFIGAAFTSVFTELFILTFTFYLVQRYLKLTLRLNSMFKIIFSASLMGGGIYFLKPFLMGKLWVILIPLGAVVYGVSLMLTGVITKEMWGLIVKKK